MAKLDSETISAALDHFGELALREVQDATERVDAQFSLDGRLGCAYHNKTLSDRTVEVYRARVGDMKAQLDKLVGHAAADYLEELTAAANRLMTTIRTRRAEKLERMARHQPDKARRDRYVAELAERLTAERDSILRTVRHGVTSPDERLPFHRRHGRSIAVGALSFVLGIAGTVAADEIGGFLDRECLAPTAQP